MRNDSTFRRSAPYARTTLTIEPRSRWTLPALLITGVAVMGCAGASTGPEDPEPNPPYRHTPEAARLHGTGENGVMIGVSDVVGTSYWLAQMLF